STIPIASSPLLATMSEGPEGLLPTEAPESIKAPAPKSEIRRLRRIYGSGVHVITWQEEPICGDVREAMIRGRDRESCPPGKIPPRVPRGLCRLLRRAFQRRGRPERRFRNLRTRHRIQAENREDLRRANRSPGEASVSSPDGHRR